MSGGEGNHNFFSVLYIDMQVKFHFKKWMPSLTKCENFSSKKPTSLQGSETLWF